MQNQVFIQFFVLKFCIVELAGKTPELKKFLKKIIFCFYELSMPKTSKNYAYDSVKLKSTSIIEFEKALNAKIAQINKKKLFLIFFLIFVKK